MYRPQLFNRKFPCICSFCRWSCLHRLTCFSVNRGEAGHNYQADGAGRHYDGSTEAPPYGANQAYGSGNQAYGGGGGYTSGAAGYEAGDYAAGGYSQPVPDAGTGYGPPPSTAGSGYTQPDTYQSYSKPGEVLHLDMLDCLPSPMPSFHIKIFHR